MSQKYGWRVWAVCVVLAVGAFALYFPALHYGFVNMDDQLYVLNNPHVNKGLRDVFGWAFQAGYANVWQPLTWISHALDCQIFGLNHPGGHHATNLILHALNSALVFLVLRQLTGAFWRSAAVAAFFAWHPLHVETAAWIAERKGLLCAFFTLLSLWSYARYAENVKSQISPTHIYYAASIILFALALMSKPVAVTLPVLLLLLDWWPLGRLPAAAPRPLAQHALFLLLEKTPFFVLSAASSVMTVMAMHANHILDPVAQLSFKARFVTCGMSYFRYIAKTFWPSDLGVIYPFAFNKTKVELISVAVLLVVISIATLRARSSRPYWLVGWLWFLVALFPSMNLVQAGAQPMSDRYMYFPSLGLWMLICWEACDLAATFRYGREVLGALCAVLLVACGVASSVQLRCWRNEGTLFARIAEPKSNVVAHADYAAYLMHHGQPALAEAECEKAIAITPNAYALQALLGRILLDEGKVDLAIQKFQSVLRANPSLDIVRVQLGLALLANKHPAEAVAEFQTVLRHDPRNFEAHHALGRVWLLQGKTADAVAEYRASLQLDINQPDTLNDLAWLLATDPHPQIRRGPEAVQLAARACQLTAGQEPVFLGTLAAADAEVGDFEKAALACQRAHDLALAQGKKAVADINLQLLTLYRAHKPYREKQ